MTPEASARHEHGLTRVRLALGAMAVVAVAWSLYAMPGFPAKRSITRPAASGIHVTPARPNIGADFAIHGALRQKPMTLVEQSFSRYGLATAQARWQAFGSPAGGIPMAPLGAPALRPSAHHWHLSPAVPPGWEQP